MVSNISAVVVAKNEEKNIKKCLDSIKWVDEIIFIDNFSIDDTVKIAKIYTKKVWVRKGGKYDSIGNNKNFGFRKATKEWILLIDADEVVTNECRRDILNNLRDTIYEGFYFNLKQFFLGKEFKSPLWTKTRIIRLFKRGYFYHDMSTHEVIKIKGKIGRIESPIIHDGYPNIETFINKMNNYTTKDARLIYEGRVAGLLKKPIKSVNFYYLFIEPALFLPYYFLIKKNYKEGIDGLVWSVLMTFYLFVERAKLWLLEQNEKNK